jgi:hypothetical protein
MIGVSIDALFSMLYQRADLNQFKFCSDLFYLRYPKRFQLNTALIGARMNASLILPLILSKGTMSANECLGGTPRRPAGRNA